MEQLGLMNLSLDLLLTILDKIVVVLGLKQACRIRLVNKLFAREVLRTICMPGNIDFSDELLFSFNHPERSEGRIFHYPREPVAEPFVTGVLLSRLNLSYAAQNHFLSLILEAEELLMNEYPDQTEEDRFLYRYALCAAETWQSWVRVEGFLSNIESVSPEKRPTTVNCSPIVNALCAAAWMGKLQLVKQLLGKGADPNVEDGYLRPPLQQAARNGHYDVVLLLLEVGANINLGNLVLSTSEWNWALYYASLRGHEQTLQLLLDPKYGACADRWYYCLMFPAFRGGQLHIVKMLLGAPYVDKILSIAKKDEVMLIDAVSYSQEGILRWLLENGAIVKNYTQRQSRWQISGRPLPYVLHLAALRGRISIVRLLLDHGAGRNNPAFCGASRNGHLEIAKLLLDTPGEDIDGAAMIRGHTPFKTNPHAELTLHGILYWQQVPLALACMNGHTSMVKFMIERGISRKLPVYHVAFAGDGPTLKVLLEARRKYSIHRDDTSILDQAIRRGAITIAIVLKKHGNFSKTGDLRWKDLNITTSN